MQLTFNDLALIKELLWGRSWPSVWLPDAAEINATDGELRKLGFIPAFLQNRYPEEVLAFISMNRGEDHEECDLAFMGDSSRVAPLGFLVNQDLHCPTGWLTIGTGIFQRVS